MRSLEEILPQKPPMIALSRVVEYDLKERTLTSEVDVSSRSIFFDEAIGGVPSYVGLEYIAQTVGCLFGIENPKTPEIELILGTGNFELFIQKFAEGHTYRISIKELFFMDEMSSFSGEISDDKNFLCANGDIKIYRGDNAAKNLEKQNG